jgi:hypothetical protein
MSRKSRQKTRRDRHYPKDRITREKRDYMDRRNALVAEAGEKYDCHIHTRRIQRYGLRPEMVIKISGYHRNNRNRVTPGEALEILRMFQAEFREMSRIEYEMRR